jgi:hypothetical protein
MVIQDTRTCSFNVKHAWDTRIVCMRLLRMDTNKWFDCGGVELCMIMIGLD